MASLRGRRLNLPLGPGLLLRFASIARFIHSPRESYVPAQQKTCRNNTAGYLCLATSVPHRLTMLHGFASRSAFEPSSRAGPASPLCFDRWVHTLSPRRVTSQHNKKPAAIIRQVICAWRRPTLPGPCGPSTIGAGGLNGRVRDGNAWFPSAIATKRSVCTLKTGYESEAAESPYCCLG